MTFTRHHAGLGVATLLALAAGICLMLIGATIPGIAAWVCALVLLLRVIRLDYRSRGPGHRRPNGRRLLGQHARHPADHHLDRDPAQRRARGGRVARVRDPRSDHVITVARPGSTACPTCGGHPAIGAIEACDSKAATTAPRPRRARARELADGAIEQLLQAAGDGLSATALIKQTGAARAKVTARLRELEQIGQMRSSGTGRTSRWHWIIDEERVAERAAELEKRQGPADLTAS